MLASRSISASIASFGTITDGQNSRALGFVVLTSTNLNFSMASLLDPFDKGYRR
jgi:hypothetical protein